MTTSKKSSSTSRLAGAFWALAGTLSMNAEGAQVAPVVDTGPAGEIAFRIDAQPIEQALKQFASQAKLQLLLDTGEVNPSVRAQDVAGHFTPAAALSQLLAHTNLQYRFVNSRTVAIRAAQAPVHDKGVTQSSRAAADEPVAEQRQSEANADPGGGLSEVIVTAQKREERLQDVPISITALGQASLERTGADKFQDYIGAVSGAFYQDAGQGRSRINIRSIETTQVGSFEEGQSPTAIYIDDFPSLNVSNPWATTDLRLYDVERVEVLRGPQGTLFGSGALGGAVRIITNKPSAKTVDASGEVGVETTDGGGPSERYDGMVNVPLVQDQLAARFVVYYRNDGGYVDNTFRNQKNTNHGDSKGGRLMLGYTPTDRLSLRFTYTTQRDFQADAPRVSLNGNPPYNYDGWNPAYTQVRLNLYNLAAEYDAGPFLVTSSTTYSDTYIDLGQGLGQRLDALFHWDSAPGTTLEEPNIFTAKTASEELRLTSRQPGRLKWTLGGFYLHQSLGQMAHWFATTNPDIFSWSVPANAKEKALFGEVTLDVTRALSVTAGARVSHYDNARHIESASGSFATLVNYGPTPIREISQSAFTPKYAISYKFTDQLMAYAQAAKGFRMGQANATGGGKDPVSGFVVPDGYKSDTLWNYEAGLKSELLDRKLRVNAAVFYIDWKDIPLLRFAPGTGDVSFTDNAGSAFSRGFEIESQARPTEHLELGLSGSYADARLYSVLPGVPFAPGDRLPGTPKVSSSNYIQVSTARWFSGADAYLRLSHRYAGKVIDNLQNSAGIESDKYSVFDARAGVQLDKYEVTLYVDNLANSDAATSRSIAALYLNPNGFEYRLRPRTIGLTFRTHLQ